MADPLLRAVEVAKQFGELTALSDVTFALQAGEVLGVVGQRGAGKSTLFHILSGAIPPSQGEIFYAGSRMRFRGAHQAHALGIEAVSQQPMLAGNINVARNIFLGREAGWPGRLRLLADFSKMNREAEELLAAFDIPKSLLRERTVDLSDEQKQVVAITRAFCRPFRLLLLDDTLATLSFHRQEILLNKIRELSGKGVAVIISSDNLKHLFAVTDRILILHQGRQAAVRPTGESTPREIVELIVGSRQHEQVTPVIWAIEGYHAAQKQAEELSRSQAALRESLEAQGSINRQLIERLRAQIGASEQLTLALRAAHTRLMTEREEERKSLARDLHDRMIQDLLSLNYRLEEIQNRKDAGAPAEELISIREGIRQTVSDLRQLCSDLRPPTIDNFGLPAAIHSLARDWSERHGIDLDLDLDPDLGRLPEPIELSAFRIVQEGLNNICKHAQAKHVRLCLQRTPTAGLRIRLCDDGQGLSEVPDLAGLSARKHFGLLGISERVALLGGAMKIGEHPAGGVVLEVEIPNPYPSA
ncbi:MAG: ATP-binding cassette domain-containing protein [Anaerolineales bacterium]|nr:ATP-binding cassette domain-containing protein [Anaerolineales bacterium]